MEVSTTSTLSISGPADAILTKGTCDTDLYNGSPANTTIWTWLLKVNAEGGTGYVGYHDWRIPLVLNANSGHGTEDVPAAAELETLLLPYNPALGCSVHPCVPVEFNNGCIAGCTPLTCSCTGLNSANNGDPTYWSGSTVRQDHVSADIIRFQAPSWGPSGKANPYHVRAVRGPVYPPTVVPSGTPTATATETTTFAIPSTPTPSESAPPTLSASPTVTAEPTATITLPTATATFTPSPPPSASPTATPSHTLAACIGDCSGIHVVAVDDIVKLVNIALGSADPSACPHGNPGGDPVTIDLIIQAVNNAMDGCLK